MMYYSIRVKSIASQESYSLLTMHCPNAFIALKVPQFNKHVSRTRYYKHVLCWYYLLFVKVIFSTTSTFDHIDIWHNCTCKTMAINSTQWRTITITYIHTYKKALLSQRRPRDAPNIWVPWKVSRVLANAPGYFSRNL